MMDVMQIVLFIAILIGIGLVIFSLIAASGDSGQQNLGYFEIDNTIKALNESMEEVDEAMTELDKMSKAVFQELDGKYQELLFLYSLIEEKKKAEAHSAPVSMKEAPSSAGEKPIFSYKNPKLLEIRKLLEDGLSISEVAQKLGMGQGEVRLILELAGKSI